MRMPRPLVFSLLAAALAQPGLTLRAASPDRNVAQVRVEVVSGAGAVSFRVAPADAPKPVDKALLPLRAQLEVTAPVRVRLTTTAPENAAPFDVDLTPTDHKSVRQLFADHAQNLGIPSDSLVQSAVKIFGSPDEFWKRAGRSRASTGPMTYPENLGVAEPETFVIVLRPDVAPPGLRVVVCDGGGQEIASAPINSVPANRAVRVPALTAALRTLRGKPARVRLYAGDKLEAEALVKVLSEAEQQALQSKMASLSDEPDEALRHLAEALIYHEHQLRQEERAALRAAVESGNGRFPHIATWLHDTAATTP
jgi:hypothetical protein